MQGKAAGIGKKGGIGIKQLLPVYALGNLAAPAHYFGRIYLIRRYAFRKSTLAVILPGAAVILAGDLHAVCGRSAPPYAHLHIGLGIGAGARHSVHKGYPSGILVCGGYGEIHLHGEIGKLFAVGEVYACYAALLKLHIAVLRAGLARKHRKSRRQCISCFKGGEIGVKTVVLVLSRSSEAKAAQQHYQCRQCTE